MLLSRIVRSALKRPRAAVADPQVPFDVAVVVQTVLRPSLERAVRSVFTQRFEGRVQVLVGVDKRLGNAGIVDRLAAECPAHMHLTAFDPGYSTSARYGSQYANFFGGGMRTILSYAANSRLVAYLDDDDWFAEEHLETLRSAIEGKSWAFSLRWYVNPANLEPMCLDTIESVGPGKGIYAERFGGFVCPSTLMLDKMRCHFILPCWCQAMGPKGNGEDRVVFEALRTRFPDDYGASGKGTSYYVVNVEDGMYPVRERFIAASGYDISRLPKNAADALRRA